MNSVTAVSSIREHRNGTELYNTKHRNGTAYNTMCSAVMAMHTRQHKALFIDGTTTPWTILGGIFSKLRVLNIILSNYEIFDSTAGQGMCLGCNDRENCGAMLLELTKHPVRSTL